MDPIQEINNKFNDQHKLLFSYDEFFFIGNKQQVIKIINFIREFLIFPINIFNKKKSIKQMDQLISNTDGYIPFFNSKALELIFINNSDPTFFQELIFEYNKEQQTYFAKKIYEKMGISF